MVVAALAAVQTKQKVNNDNIIPTRNIMHTDTQRLQLKSEFHHMQPIAHDNMDTVNWKLKSKRTQKGGNRVTE